VADAAVKGRWFGGLATLAILAAIFWMAYGKGCDQSAGGDVQSVKVGGEWFHLELAADEAVRMKGLGGRTQIDKDGGMLFVFPVARRSSFVMRDCPIDIDIIYLSPEGRVLTTYAMKAEPPRAADGSEGKAGQFGETPESQRYEERLVKYDSRYPTQFVIELRGGRLKELKTPVKEGDKIDLPYEELKKRAK
jgi:uncharacterized membrane protein (UPF0127 family)